MLPPPRGPKVRVEGANGYPQGGRHLPSERSPATSGRPRRWREGASRGGSGAGGTERDPRLPHRSILLWAMADEVTGLDFPSLVPGVLWVDSPPPA